MAIEKAPPPTDPYGYADGTAKPGNAIARRHGGRQVRRMEEVREAELYQQWADDLGGEANLTAGQRAILLRTVENHLIADTAFQYVRQCARLSFTSKRVKDALATHAASTDREYRGAALLTLRRTERPVRTLEEEMGDS